MKEYTQERTEVKFPIDGYNITINYLWKEIDIEIKEWIESVIKTQGIEFKTLLDAAKEFSRKSKKKYFICLSPMNEPEFTVFEYEYEYPRCWDNGVLLIHVRWDKI